MSLTPLPTTLPLAYWHVDVFSPAPFGGNSLTVFADAAGLSAAQMRDVTREMRHFESIFILPNSGADVSAEASPPAGCSARARARVFDLEGELDFAGHPILGAACVLHARLDEGMRAQDPRHAERWAFELNAHTVFVDTERLTPAPTAGANARGPQAFRAVLDQGRPKFLGHVAAHEATEFAEALGVIPTDLHPELPLEIVSTGLRYLVVPLVSGLAGARITRPDFEELLAGVGAEYAYLLDLADPECPEGRHWNNDGILEDVATGSGAGCASAYLVKHGVLATGRDTVLRQGRFTGRPSEIRIRAEGRSDDVTRVLVGGDVVIVGRGMLDALPNGRTGSDMT